MLLGWKVLSVTLLLHFESSYTHPVSYPYLPPVVVDTSCIDDNTLPCATCSIPYIHLVPVVNPDAMATLDHVPDMVANQTV